MKLSILVCSTQNRYDNFLLKILKQLFDQAEALPFEYRYDVEIITVIDNKTRMLGTKRNDLLDMAQGKYVVFVDDDDRIADDYIIRLLEAVAFDKDIICFDVSVSIDGGEPKPCFYSNQYESDFNMLHSYHRLPNHIMAVKKALALKVKYKDILKGEDSDYAKRLLPLLRTEYRIDKILYHYDYSNLTTETQQKLKRK